MASLAADELVLLVLAGEGHEGGVNDASTQAEQWREAAWRQYYARVLIECGNSHLKRSHTHL